MTRAQRFVVGPLLLLVVLLSSACAVTTKAKLQQTDLSVYSSLSLIQTTEKGIFTTGALCGTVPCINEAAHQRFSGYLVTALKAGQAFHLTVLAWQEGQPVPVDIQQLSTAIRAMSDVVKTLIPESPQRDQINVVIDAAAFAINQAVVLFLPKVQADALFPVTTAVVTTGQ